MRKLTHKLTATTAETLLETLISILIATLSVTLLTTAVMASARMNHAAAKADEEYNAALRTAECQEGTPVEKKVEIDFEDAGLSDKRIDVYIYGDGDFASYKKK